MPRTKRLILPNLPHHVTIRGNNRRRLFSYPTDYFKMIGLIGMGLKNTRCSLHALTLMTNHLHLVITPPDASALPALIKQCCQRYATYRNDRRHASGKLFEERYYSVPIVTVEQLAITTVYSDLNPYRAGLAPRSVPYHWSTYAFHVDAPHLSRIPYSLWTPSKWYLSLGDGPEERAQEYREWIDACVADDLRPDPAHKVAKAERQSTEVECRRVERPDRSCAR